MDVVLVVSKRRVRDIRPRDAVALVVLLGSRHDGGVIADRDGLAGVGLGGDVEGLPRVARLFGATTVVGQEEDQRVVHHAALLQRVDDVADRLVHQLDLCRIDLHAARLPLLVRSLIPRQLRRIAFAHAGGLVHHSHLAHALQALVPEGVPPHVVAPLVLRNGLFRGMQGPVGRGEGHVEEERGIRALVERLADELRGVLANRGRVVEVRAGVLGVVAARERYRVVKRARAVDRAEELVESALHRPV